MRLCCHAHHIILAVPCDDVDGREWNQNDGEELTQSSRHLHTVPLFISYDVPAQQGQGVVSVNEHHPEYAYRVCSLQTLPALYIGFTLLAAGLSPLWRKCGLHYGENVLYIPAYAFPFRSVHYFVLVILCSYHGTCFKL
jgi:hypothetical protein